MVVTIAMWKAEYQGTIWDQ